MQTTSTPVFGDDASAVRLRRLLNEGMLALLAGLGSRAGWLEALAAVQPAGGDVVARAASVEEGRMRAWLSALVAGGLIEYDGARDTYALPHALAAFLRGESGRAYQRGLGELVRLASSLPRPDAADAPAGPPVAELLGLVPGLSNRLARGAGILVVGRGADALGRALAASFPASRLSLASRGGIPRGARGRFDLALSRDAGGARTGFAARLHDALAAGGDAVLAVPALSDSPADDALHPVGPYLLGARALAAPRPPAAEAPLPARLAAAGFEVSALARVPSDPFHDYLVIRKPTFTNR